MTKTPYSTLTSKLKKEKKKYFFTLIENLGTAED